MSTDRDAKLIAEYEKLRQCLAELFEQVETTDRRLVEIEKVLPDAYVYPGDRSPGQLSDLVPRIGSRKRK